MRRTRGRRRGRGAVAVRRVPSFAGAALLPLALPAAASAQQGTPPAPDRPLPVEAAANPGGWPLTRAERSGFLETSRYADVVAFLTALQAAGNDRTGSGDPASDTEERPGRLRFTSFGYSEEGRSLPLVIYGDPPPLSASAARGSGRVRVLVLADIHAGEVAGKEAALILLRDLARGRHASWADSLILLVAPIYNADGNERISLRNRPRQHGPIGGMGQRANVRGLDLNRDNTKLESAEARSLARLLNEFDPHVALDLHTTNGTIHAYHLTYSPPLHPNTDPAIDTLLRDRWLPEVTASMRRKYGWEIFPYGNVPPIFGMEGERGWYTFDHRPRFTTNYWGLRNRFGILAEAYAYATFEDRVRAHLRFVEEVIDWAWAHAGEISSAVAQADARWLVGTRLALRAAPRRGDSVEVLLGEVARERHPYTGEPMWRRLEVRRPEWMPEYGSFAPAETERVPAAYLLPSDLGSVIERLHAHGIRSYEISNRTAASGMELEAFRIDSTCVAEREFQGHAEREVFGRWTPVRRTVPSGTIVVPVDQPLGRLAFLLLEPRSDDGFLNWNLLDGALEGATEYPILRVPESRPGAAPHGR